MKMSTAAAIQSDAIWLRPGNYNVAALNTKLVGRVPELKQALNDGVAACPDLGRVNFYDVELPSGWAYIHVRDDKHTVYLIAYSRN
jgi:hypothetical protein